jgi:hypothetical protein
MIFGDQMEAVEYSHSLHNSSDQMATTALTVLILAGDFFVSRQINISFFIKFMITLNV